MQPERVQAQLAAKERAKQARLYNGHADSVAHSSSGGACTAGVAAAAEQRDAVVAPAASNGSVTGAGEAAVAPGAEAGAGPVTPTGRGTAPAAAPLGPAGEPERGSAEWLAAQEAYEDAHLGQFERVMPPPDPQLVGGAKRLGWWGGVAARLPCSAASSLHGVGWLRAFDAQRQWVGSRSSCRAQFPCVSTPALLRPRSMRSYWRGRCKSSIGRPCRCVVLLARQSMRGLPQLAGAARDAPIVGALFVELLREGCCVLPRRGATSSGSTRSGEGWHVVCALSHPHAGMLARQE